MKHNRWIPAVLALVLACSALAGCNKKDTAENGAQTETTVNRDMKIPTMGLTYTLPDVWTDYLDTNIYFESLSSDSVFGKLTYYYVTDADYETISTGNPLADISDYLYPICTIAVVQKDKVESSGVTSLFQEYNERELVDSYEDYQYYVLWDTRKDTSALQDRDETLYVYLRSGVSSLKGSVAARPFDPTALEEQKAALQNTITFVTTTLEGESIDSTVFADYDVTMLNLTAAYAIASYDESATMQEVYTRLQASYPNVNLIQGAIDTPLEDADQIMKDAKAAVGGQYTSIVMDSTLRTWVANNLPGVPVTLMIDHNGQIIGDMIVGVKTADEYMELIDNALAEVAARNE